MSEDADVAAEMWGQLAREAVRLYLFWRHGPVAIPKDLDAYTGEERAVCRRVGAVLAHRVALYTAPPQTPCRHCGRPKAEHKAVGQADPPLFLFCRAGPPGSPQWNAPAPDTPEFTP